MPQSPPNATPLRWERETRVRVLALCGLAFLLMLSYSVARPASESLFLEANGADALPQVWLLVALASAGVVALYNRVLPGRDLAALFGLAAAISAAVLVACITLMQLELSFAATLLYVWKDVYMVVLVEIFYSFSNSVFPIARARWLYGLFGFVGAIGGLIGNLGVGALSQSIGSLNALWWVLVPLAGLVVGAFVLARLAGRTSFVKKEGGSGLMAGLEVVSKSRYLLLMLGLIAIVQVTITLVDLQFNTFVALAYPDKDLRTAEIAFVYAAISGGTLVLHALSGPILRLGSVPKTLLLVPLVLLGAGAGFVIAPGLLTVALLKISSKTFDYTLFRNSKEILYIPLSDVERTQGKSIVDMLTYRVAKGGASLLLLALAAIRSVNLVSALIFAAVLVWLGLTALLTRRFRARVSRAQELELLAR